MTTMGGAGFDARMAHLDVDEVAGTHAPTVPQAAQTAAAPSTPESGLLYLQQHGGNRAVAGTVGAGQAIDPMLLAAMGDQLKGYLSPGNQALQSFANNPEGFARALLGAGQQQLEAAGVPPIVDLHLTGGGSPAGGFDPQTWTLSLNQTLVEDAVGNGQGDVVAAVTAMERELRHAEQAYRIAQMLAGQRRDRTEEERVAYLETFLNVPDAVGQEASKQSTLLAPGEVSKLVGDHLFDEGDAPATNQSHHLADLAVAVERSDRAAEATESDPDDSIRRDQAASAQNDLRVAIHTAYEQDPKRPPVTAVRRRRIDEEEEEELMVGQRPEEQER